jgi:hypothetical protein
MLPKTNAVVAGTNRQRLRPESQSVHPRAAPGRTERQRHNDSSYTQLTNAGHEKMTTDGWTDARMQGGRRDSWETGGSFKLRYDVH